MLRNAPAAAFVNLAIIPAIMPGPKLALVFASTRTTPSACTFLLHTDYLVLQLLVAPFLLQRLDICAKQRSKYDIIVIEVHIFIFKVQNQLWVLFFIPRAQTGSHTTRRPRFTVGNLDRLIDVSELDQNVKKRD